MKRTFLKPPLTLEDQIQLLKRRGLVIEDEERAKEFLQRVHYNRLRPYWHSFEVDLDKHVFQEGTKFEDVVLLYELDRRLRLLVMEAVERFEVALRSRWAYELAHVGGPFAYCDEKLFCSKELHQRDLKAILKEWERAVNHDPLFRHFRENYKEPNPPIWLVVECVSFGTLARFFGNLHDSLGRAISAPFGLPYSFLKSAVKHLSVVRNIAAHHGRLWDRELTAYTLPFIHKNPKTLEKAMQKASEPQRVYRTLAFLVYLMEKLHPEDDWKDRLLSLLSSFGKHLYARMGFPRDYRELELWS